MLMIKTTSQYFVNTQKFNAFKYAKCAEIVGSFVLIEKENTTLHTQLKLTGDEEFLVQEWSSARC